MHDSCWCYNYVYLHTNQTKYTILSLYILFYFPLILLCFITFFLFIFLTSEGEGLWPCPPPPFLNPPKFSLSLRHPLPPIPYSILLYVGIFLYTRDLFSSSFTVHNTWGVWIWPFLYFLEILIILMMLIEKPTWGQSCLRTLFLVDPVVYHILVSKTIKPCPFRNISKVHIFINEKIKYTSVGD